MFSIKSSICNKLFVPNEMDYYFKEMDYYFAIFAINSKNIDAPTPALKYNYAMITYYNKFRLQEIIYSISGFY
jgi:hypothetical protein